tara:strand:- start:174 stop:557 length:384 start_codon:yes stop_codon:yes gene_type:complete
LTLTLENIKNIVKIYVIINIINLLLTIIFLYFDRNPLQPIINDMFGNHVIHIYSIICLFEAAFLFIIGGTMDLSGSVIMTKSKQLKNPKSPDYDSKKHIIVQKRASKFIILGIVFLSQSLLITYLFN